MFPQVNNQLFTRFTTNSKGWALVNSFWGERQKSRGWAFDFCIMGKFLASDTHKPINKEGLRVMTKTCKNKSVCVLSGYKILVTSMPTNCNASPKVTLQHTMPTYCEQSTWQKFPSGPYSRRTRMWVTRKLVHVRVLGLMRNGEISFSMEYSNWW
jgi:hypothetical protein